MEEYRNVKGVQELISQLNALESQTKEAGKAVSDHIKELAKADKDALAGANLALKEFSEETKNTGKYIHDLVKQTLYNVENIFANKVLDLLEGRAVKIRDLFRSLSNEVLSMLVKIGIRETLTPKITDFVRAIIGGTSTASSTSTVTLSAEKYSLTSPTIAAFLAGKSEGGIITGGVPGKDSVPIMAMPGEYVLNRHAVSYYGVDFIEALNRMRLPKYAEGGIVGAPRPAPAQSSQPQTIVVQNTFHVTDPLTFEKYVKKTGIDRLIAQRVKEQLEAGY